MGAEASCLALALEIFFASQALEMRPDLSAMMWEIQRSQFHTQNLRKEGNTYLRD